MNRTLIFSPAARSRLFAIASSQGDMMLRQSCPTASHAQIRNRTFGGRGIGASNPMSMIARSTPRRQASIVASRWRGGAAGSENSDDGQSSVGRIEIITGPMFSGKSTELLRRAAEHEAAGRRVALVSSSKDIRYGVSSVVTHAGVARRCISVSRLSDLRAAIESSSIRDKESSSVIEKAAAATTAAATAAGKATPTPLPPPPPTPPLLPSLDSYDVVAIDEAQFFDDLVPFATAMADGRGGGDGGEGEAPPPSPATTRAFTVLVAGLDGDSTRGVFGGVLQLVPHAEKVTRLAAECAFCGAEAHFSVRLSSSSPSTSTSTSTSGLSSSPQPGAARVPAPTLENSSSSPQVQVGGAESYAPACRRHYLQHSESTSGGSKVLVERQK